MTVPTNLYQKASLKGDREDLIDKIYNTAPPKPRCCRLWAA